MAAPLRTILDVDTGTDDAIALAFAVRAAALDLVAVTTVAGNVEVSKTTENTRRVLAYVGAGDLPVHRGHSRPLARPLHDAGHFHGASGLGLLVLPEAPGTTSQPGAPQFLVDTIMIAPGTLTLIAVGPLTNLAAAIALEPALPAALGQLVIMGGSLSGGNVTPYAEFNIFCDPEAAAQVFDACALTMVGLDVTHQTVLTSATRERLRAQRTPQEALLYGATAIAFEQRGEDRFHLHDPLAVGVAIDPSLCTMRRGTLRVDTAGDSAGQTHFQDDPAGKHQVCVGVDAPRFLTLLATTLDLPDLTAD